MNSRTISPAGPITICLGAERPFDAFNAWASRASLAHAWGIILLTIGLVGIADIATGSDAWLGPLYLVIICIAAWVYGWRAGLLVGLACAAVSIGANGINPYPLGGAAAGWNMAMRILAVAIIVVLVGNMRRSYDQEFRRARSDGLTGALNRQAFYEKTAIARHTEGWGILAYVDLDGLKQINDGYGHAAGDATLRAFADGVRKIIRDSDIFARVGGDEFLVFVPVSDEAEGYYVARQLHERINRIPSDLDFPVRCSVGALVLEPGSTALSEADVQLADQLMYQAKQQGAALRISTKRRQQ